MIQNLSVNKNIRLHYIPMSKVKTTSIGVYIHRQLNEKNASYNALLPYVMRRSCKLCKSSKEMSAYLENLYGASLWCDVLKFGEDQVLAFEGETVSDCFTVDNVPLVEDLFRLIVSIIFEQDTSEAFDVQSTEQEKKNAKERIEALINDKRKYAPMRCREEMCKGDNYAISKLGTIEGVNEITPEGLYEYYKTMVVSSVIDIYLCGSCGAGAFNTVAEKLTEFTDNLKFTAASVSQTKILTSYDNKVREITEKMDVTQGKLSIGFRSNMSPLDVNYPALTVLNAIYGGGANSKLFNNVREKLSLAYYASSALDKYKGLMIVNAGIEFNNFDKTLKESLNQLEEIKKGNITDEEFRAAVVAILDSLEAVKDDPDGMIISDLSGRVLNRCRSVDEKKALIKEVSKDDVVRVAGGIEEDTVYFLRG